MCGVAGLINTPNQTSKIDEMLRSIAHRGPDATGKVTHSFSGSKATFGHQRLSIIDLSDSANQPFKKDRLTIVYNGEIYNYKELMEELKGKGASFRTNSDTETVLEAWRMWGPACLPRLRGMFAFSIYDSNTGKTYLARDHFGIKPLFYFASGGQLIFASELKAVALALDQTPEINTRAIVASLMYYWLPESVCIYKNVHKFPAGAWAEFTPESGLKFNTYWDPQHEVIANGNKPEVDISTLQDALENSVKAHMVADVPVSTFLSGGLDSSLITVIAAQLTGNIDSYCMKFRDVDKRFEAMPEDLKYARIVAQKYGIKLHEIELNPNMANMLPEIVSILDEPIGDAAAINTLLICQAARKAGVKVLLSGMGADEIFGGYRKHYACMLAHKYRLIPAPIRKWGVEPIINALPVAGKSRGYRYFRWAQRFARFAGQPEEAAYRGSYTLFGVEEIKQMLNQDLWPDVDALVDEHNEIYWQGPPDDQVNRMCYTDMKMFLPGLNLTYSDRAGMAASTEIRVPFVDKHIVDMAFRISGSRKISGGEGKLALKLAAEKWLPKEIVYRPKTPFGAPIRAWIRRDLQEMVNDTLGEDGLLKRGLLDKSYVNTIINDDRKGITDNAHRIWQFLTLETWFRNANL